jgi:hypothetical protein
LRHEVSRVAEERRGNTLGCAQELAKLLGKGEGSKNPVLSLTGRLESLPREPHQREPHLRAWW